jgi:hypothetical protein
VDPWRADVETSPPLERTPVLVVEVQSPSTRRRISGARPGTDVIQDPGGHLVA